MVPTVERVVRTALRCSMAMAGGIPSMLSTCGLSIRSKNWRAYGENVSIYRRCPSAKRVSKARELLPEPLKPVITISFLSGKSKSKFFRLLWRTPRRRITEGADDFNIRKQSRICDCPLQGFCALLLFKFDSFSPPATLRSDHRQYVASLRSPHLTQEWSVPWTSPD